MAHNFDRRMDELIPKRYLFLVLPVKMNMFHILQAGSRL